MKGEVRGVVAGEVVRAGPLLERAAVHGLNEDGGPADSRNRQVVEEVVEVGLRAAPTWWVQTW